LASFDDVLRHFGRQIELKWRPDEAPEGRVWILWYDKALDRRVRGRLHELQQATEVAGHGWRHLDLAKIFPTWIVGVEFLPRLLRRPEQLSGLLAEFRQVVALRVRQELDAAGQSDLVALSGCASLFGQLRTADLVADVSPHIRGRLLLLFPGQHHAGIYRLLDARESWNYRAVPIPSSDTY
jgi:hypothetical protein